MSAPAINPLEAEQERQRLVDELIAEHGPDWSVIHLPMNMAPAERAPHHPFSLDTPRLSWHNAALQADLVFRATHGACARPTAGGDMRRTLAIGWVGALLLAGGCATGPLQENPLVIRPAAKADVADNPVYVPLGPTSYAAVFEKVLDVVGDYNFEIAYSNRYDGRIETFPKIAPGLGQPWKGGSPDFHQRLVASFQTIRHRAIVLISPASA